MAPGSHQTTTGMDGGSACERMISGTEKKSANEESSEKPSQAAGTLDRILLDDVIAGDELAFGVYPGFAPLKLRQLSSASQLNSSSL